MSAPRRKPKPKTLRSEVFALRLDPKLKYLAEIAARKQRRSLANFVEWAIESALRHTPLDAKDSSRSILDDAADLWCLDEAERFMKLAEEYPDLLTYEEQILWEQARRNPHFIPDPMRPGPSGILALAAWRLKVKHCWTPLKEFSQGTISRDQLNDALTELLKPNT